MGKENKWIKYLVLKTERKLVLALLCSLLNTAVKYNPAGWGVPYNHVMFADTREMLVTLCLQVLLVLLDYRSPSNRINNATVSSNNNNNSNSNNQEINTQTVSTEPTRSDGGSV